MGDFLPFLTHILTCFIMVDRNHRRDMMVVQEYDVGVEHCLYGKVVLNGVLVNKNNSMMVLNRNGRPIGIKVHTEVVR